MCVFIDMCVQKHLYWMSIVLFTLYVEVVCVCVFCDFFLCSISVLLLSGSLSYILNSVL